MGDTRETAFERLEDAIGALRGRWFAEHDRPFTQATIDAFDAWKVAREADPPDPDRERAPAPLTPDADERAQAERWARARIEVAQRFVPDWEDLDDDDRENEIAAMLPLVREARAWQAEADRYRAQRDEAEGLNENERDTAARATAELAEARAEIKAAHEALAGAEIPDGVLVERIEDLVERAEEAAEDEDGAVEVAAGAITEAANLRAEIERLRAPAPLTKAALGVVSAWDARAKDGQPVPGGMLMIGNAIERLRNEVRIAPAPLTEEEARAWADLHDQTQAGCLTREEAHAADVALILSVSRGDIPDAVRAPPSEAVLLTAREAAEAMIDKGREMEAEGQRRLREVVRAERHRARGDVSADVRPESSPAVQAALRGLERVAPVDVVPALTREEALRRLDALSPTAVRHLSTARDWLAVYEKSAYRDSEHDEMAAILRAYLAGLPPAEAAPPFHAVWPTYDDGPDHDPKGGA